MKTKLLKLSREINADFLQALVKVSEVADEHKIEVFVVGATARDIILQEGYGLDPRRVTVDIDFGIQVEDWGEFSELKNALIATRMFVECRSPQRLIFNNKFPVDIVPFGQISDPDDSILWPTEQDFKMSTIGFKDAYNNSLTVELKANPAFHMKFASLSGLVTMKIISWDEKYPERTKDAIDLEYIMRKYIDAGNEERFFGEALDLNDEEDIDYEYKSSRLLGRDVASISEPKTKKAILAILEKQTGIQDRYKLVEDMMRSNSGLEDNFEEKLYLLEAFKKGFIERM
jgi:predicted nucleotidyltransferase